MPAHFRILFMSLGIAIATPGAGLAQSGSEAEPSETRTRADAAWANRDDETSLRTALRLYDRALVALPSQKVDEKRKLFQRLAQGSFLLANYFLTETKAQQSMYQRTALLGEACLRLEPAYARRVKSSKEDAIEAVSKPFAGCLFFKAAGSSRDAQMTGILKSLSRKSEIDAMMKRVYKLDPTFLYGAPDRYYGVYYAVLPGFLGGSEGKSKEHFEKALAIAPDFLGTQVLMAENLYDKGSAEYKNLLTEVVRADPGAAPPNYVPENRMEQGKARRLLGGSGTT